jgi:hypothetical protein
MILWKQYSRRKFSDDFRPIPAGKHRKFAGIYQKKCEQFPAGIFDLGFEEHI